MFRRSKLAVIVAAGLVAVPLGALVVPASASSECTVEELPQPYPDALIVRVVDGDPSGKYLVGNVMDVSGLLWTDGEVEELDGPDGSQRTQLADVNSSGVVAGYSITGAGEETAWIYQNGEYTTLPTPAASGGVETTGINENGDVVGYDRNRNTATTRPLMWPADDPGTVVQLNGVEGSTIAPTEISDERVIVGDGIDSALTGPHAYYWPDPASDGDWLSDDAEDVETQVFDITSDWAVGSRTAPDGTIVGLRWNLADGTETETPAALHSINSAGDVSGKYGRKAHIIRADGTTTVLPPLTSKAPGRRADVIFDQDSAISAAGSARITDRPIQVRPVVWRGC